MVLPAARKLGAPIYIIPAGQVITAVVRCIESAGGVGNLRDRAASLCHQRRFGQLDQVPEDACLGASHTTECEHECIENWRGDKKLRSNAPMRDTAQDCNK